MNSGFFSPLWLTMLHRNHWQRPAGSRQAIAVHEVPVVIVKGLTDDQRQRLQIADNRLGELSKWDQSGLTEQVEQLSETQRPEIPGFSHEELCDLLGLAEMSKAKCEFPPEIEKTIARSDAHFLVSCRASDLDKMARLVAALSCELWCTLEQASR